MITLSALSLTTVFLAQAQAPPPVAVDRPPDSAGEATARLAIMRQSLMVLNVHPIDDRGASFRLQPEPIFRFTNPVGSSVDGAIFFWLGENDRPEAAVQVSLSRLDGRWFQEFVSLSPVPLIAESSDSAAAWTPPRGVELKPVPGAPKPAETAEQRLRQMRALVEDFAAQDNFQDQSWQRLRLLPKPLARYGKPGTDLFDGALFSFVLGTDPEACVMLEVRTGKDGPEWQYAFAPMSTYALKGSWKGQDVWSLPRRKRSVDKGPDKTFYQRTFATWRMTRSPGLDHDLCVSLVTVLLAQAPPPVADDPAARSADEAAARLALMKRSLTVFDVHPIADRGATYRLQPEPIFRFTNPVGTSVGWGIFFWFGENDRPEATVQVFLNRTTKRWVQEFISLSPVPLIAESSTAAVAAWTPAQGRRRAQARAGCPEARGDRRAEAPPDASPDGGLRRSGQLPGPVLAAAPPPREAARALRQTGHEPARRCPLQLRSRHRSRGLSDARGAHRQDGPEWQYAFAPMSTYALKGAWKGQEVWSLPRRKGVDCGPDQPFHQRTFQPGE